MRTLVLALLLCCGWFTPVQGDFVITFGSSQLFSGGPGSIDVFITGDGSPLGRFAYQFDITGANALTGDLQFASVQSKNEQQAGNYVFGGDVDPVNLSTRRDVNPTTAIGDDSTFSGNAFPIGAAPRLLARLELQHIGTGGGTFTINLNIGNSEFDADADFITNNSYASAQISSVAGTIFVNAVPEPSSIILLSLACTGLALRARHSKPCRT